MKKQAFVELQNGEIFEITDFRCPTTHCKVNEGARVRLDQPRFRMTETDTDVTLSLHERYMELLPRFAVTVPDDVREEEEEEGEDGEMEVDDTDECSGMASMFETCI